jgi:hypothetical protein
MEFGQLAKLEKLRTIRVRGSRASGVNGVSGVSGGPEGSMSIGESPRYARPRSAGGQFVAKGVDPNDPRFLDPNYGKSRQSSNRRQSRRLAMQRRRNGIGRFQGDNSQDDGETSYTEDTNAHPNHREYPTLQVAHAKRMELDEERWEKKRQRVEINTRNSRMTRGAIANREARERGEASRGEASSSSSSNVQGGGNNGGGNAVGAGGGGYDPNDPNASYEDEPEEDDSENDPDYIPVAPRRKKKKERRTNANGNGNGNNNNGNNNNNNQDGNGNNRRIAGAEEGSGEGRRVRQESDLGELLSTRGMGRHLPGRNDESDPDYVPREKKKKKRKRRNVSGDPDFTPGDLVGRR